MLHLRIPGWYYVSIVEPLHFPDDLQPSQIHGLKHKGKAYTAFNLPAAPVNLLDGVGNIIDPRADWGAGLTPATVSVSLNGVSAGLGFATTAATAAAAGLGVFGVFAVGVPIWWGGALFLHNALLEPTVRTVHNLLKERHQILRS